jgi:hypothetical protein
VREGLTLEGLGGPQERAACRKARIAELIGDRGVHVHDQGYSQEPRERRRQVGGLLHRVYHVVTVRHHPIGGLGHERDVEEQLRERGPCLHASHRKAQAAPMHQPRQVYRRPLGIGQEVDLVPQAGEGPNHGENGQGCSPHLEERLRREEQDPQ